VPPTLRQRIIDGVRYRQLRFDGNGAFATLSVLGDPDEMNGRIFFEFLRKGRVTIRMDVDTADPRGAVRYSSATLNGDAHSLEVHDLAAWGPGMDAQGNPTLAGAYLDSISNREVGGAITDGASSCLLRLDSPETGISPTQLTMMKRGSQPGDPDPIQVSRQIGGTMHSPNPAALPPLPTPGDTTAQPTIELESGKAFYVPPDSYIDPSRTPWLTAPQVSHNTQETCLMSIVGSLPDGQVMRGGRSFVLRRPPIVLVHGIMSSPATWGTNQYSEMLGTPVPARLYRVNYSSTATKGYSENFDHVPRMISSALRDYRNALDDSPTHHPSRGFRGVKYAATRADVIGHSQGGQLTRTYISTLDWSNFGPQARTRDGAATQWPAALFFRSEYERYLRPNNWGAGDIRRFIPIGSPFKGSPYATAFEPFLEPTLNLYERLELIRPAVEHTSLWALLHPQGVYSAPTTMADLTEGSRVQSLLENPSAYPAGHKAVPWVPMVGIATEPVGEAPVQAALWELLFTFTPLLPSNPFEIDPVGPTNSDLIVEQWSQRNADDASDNPHAALGWVVAHHLHAEVGALGSFEGETESDAISIQIGKQLSQPKSSFTNGVLH
jgi:pimeloyl-ACP methyl ester carboxylesterase